MTKIWCVGGRHYSKSINQSVYVKVNPKTHEIAKVSERKCTICGRNESQTFTK